MNKLNPNKLHESITKLQSSDDKMILLNLISQEHYKYIHYKIEKDKFKSVLKDLLKNPQYNTTKITRNTRITRIAQTTRNTRIKFRVYNEK